MRFKIIITPSFERDSKPLLKRYKSLKEDLIRLFESLEKEPTQGQPLGKNCFKIRLSITSKGKGKSGGARVITFVKITTENVYLLTIYDKSEKDSLSDKEFEELLSNL